MSLSASGDMGESVLLLSLLISCGCGGRDENKI